MKNYYELTIKTELHSGYQHTVTRKVPVDFQSETLGRLIADCVRDVEGANPYDVLAHAFQEVFTDEDIEGKVEYGDAYEHPDEHLRKLDKVVEAYLEARRIKAEMRQKEMTQQGA